MHLQEASYAPIICDMNLNEYLVSKNSHPAEIAEKTGLSVMTVWRVMRGHTPSYRVAERIVKATDGAVSLADLRLDDGPLRRLRQANADKLLDDMQIATIAMRCGLRAASLRGCWLHKESPLSYPTQAKMEILGQVLDELGIGVNENG